MSRKIKNAADHVYEKTEYERASINYRLGKCYLHGEGVERDICQALHFLLSAEKIFVKLIENGDTFAETALKSVRKEMDKAIKMLYKLHGFE